MARGTEISAYWRPEGIEGVELFEARFRHHTYARHSHPSYAIGAVEVGAQAFWCGGGERVVAGGGLVTIDPGRVHDGHAADAAGVRYRMLYIEPVAYGAILRAIAPGAGGPPYFPEPTATDRDLAPAFLAMHRRLAAAPGGEPCAMARETGIFRFLAALALRHARSAPRLAPVVTDGARARRACDFMAENLARKLRLGDVAAEVGLSRYHFLRQFRRTTGLPPHAYLNQLRLERARALLGAGEPPAQAAAAVGFCDQAHLTHRFKAAYGITPGQFATATAS